MKIFVLLLIILSLFDIPQKHQNILVIGDSEAGSISFALQGAKKKGESSGETAARMAGSPYQGENVAFEFKGGTPIDYWSKQGHGKEALDKHPETDTVFVFLGTNDFYKQAAPDVEPLLKEIRDRNIKCVWAGNTSVHNKKWAINKKLKEAVEADCSYVDSESIQLGDGVHPTFQGVVQWLKLIWSVK